MSEQRWVKVARDGKVIYSKPLPDYAERRLAAETLGKKPSRIAPGNCLISLPRPGGILPAQKHLFLERWVASHAALVKRGA